MASARQLVAAATCAGAVASCQGAPNAAGSDSGSSSDSDTDTPDTDAPPGDPGDCDPALRWPGRVSLSNLTELRGYVAVDGSVSLQQIEDGDLTALSCVEEITGELSIQYSPGLTTLHGLERLARIGEVLHLRFNDNLLDVDGLSGLTDVSTINLWDNPALEHADALAGIAGHVERISVQGNFALVRLRFPEVTSATSVIVFGNDVLETCELPALTRLGNLSYRKNPSLLDLSGLGALEEVEGSFYVQKMNALQSTRGVDLLRSVGGVALFTENAMQEELFFPLLEEIGELSVRDNPALEAIVLPAISRIAELNLGRLDALTEFASLSATQGIGLLRVYGISGLEDLDWVTGLEDTLEFLYVGDNPALTNIDALTGVERVTFHVNVSNLPGITDLGGLAGLRAIDGSLVITDMPALSSLSGLDDLESVGWRLYMERNPALTDLGGLASLTSTGGLEISENEGLSSLSGLDGLTTIDGAAILARNPELIDLVGLQSLRTITGGLEISDNPALVDISSIMPTPVGMLETVGDPALTIERNASLSECMVQHFVDALIATGWLALVNVGDNLACPAPLACNGPACE